jgi:putative glutamine amidotransferase
MAIQRPLIGVTTDTVDGKPAYYLSYAYAEAIEKAGGLPLPIPYRTSHALIPDYLDRVDGILFTGGDDLDPSLYGEQWHPKAGRVDPQRQSFELALLAEVERRRIPALFVCFGCQLLNVYRGGSLHQFIPDLAEKTEHRKVGEVLRRHEVHIKADSKLAAVIGSETVSANTYHKQAVNRVGRSLRVVATAPDGIIEGLEDPAFPMMLAVQWHPERLAGELAHLALFEWLVKNAIIAGASRNSPA